MKLFLFVFFIVMAALNIAIQVIKWYCFDEKEFNWSAIFGWFCAILYCIGDYID
jgi:hypothetical protein